MIKNCLGFPIKKGRLNMRIAKEIYRSFRVCGFNNFKLSDYNKYAWKVGDLAHECDGFNWRIAKIVPVYRTTGLKYGKVLCDIEFYKEDGTQFCHVMKPLTHDEVVKYWEALKQDKSDWNFAGHMIEQYGNFTINHDGTITKGKA